ncbi:MAG: HlyD family type I secretion periplasmic adaptor subunit [Proteobacteria bacterium]|nr:HlyD family type I secretion periplasmic adaptor subunit [Pseudomonadota bacterium]
MMRRLFSNKNDSHEFKPLLVEIDEEPQNPLGRIIFWTIMAAILFFALWMYFGKVDVVITARGKVIPRGEIKVLQPLTTGVIKTILVKAGDFVSKGQILMEIDPAQTGPELESIQANLMQVDLEIKRIQATLAKLPFAPIGNYDQGLVAMQRQLYHSSRQRLADQLQIREEQLRQLEEKQASLEKMLSQHRYLAGMHRERLQRLEQVRDIISREEYNRTESDLKGSENDIAISEHQLEESRAARREVEEEMVFLKEDERNRLLSELPEKRRYQLDLQANVERSAFVTARQQIVSPVAGYVNNLLIHTVGGVVTPAEKLISVVPSESPLVIKALVESKDIGFVAAEMAASIKVDAFSFQKYGIVEGRVEQVARDSLEDEQLGLIYELYVTPLQTHLMVEGQESPITSGMGVTVEIKTGKRRIIEFFIYPMIKYLDEGISVR